MTNCRFTKTYRINKIMENAAHFKRLKVTAMSVEKPMAVLLLLNVIVLTVWTAMDPLQHETVINIDPFNTETYGVCTSDHGYIFLAILGVINIGSLAIAVFQAYKARNHSKELHESRYIFMIVGLFLVVSFIGIPVIVMARENTEVFYFVVVAMIFVSESVLILTDPPSACALIVWFSLSAIQVGCASILLLLFVPKVQRHRSGRAGGAWNASRRSSMLTTLGHSRRASQQEKLFLISVFEMAISPEQLNIVQTSWEKVVPIADVAADLFYNKLFELDPTLRPLFPDDLTDQKEKLLAMLTVAVESLTDLKELLPKVEQLGRRHILYYGVTASMFPTVGAALLDTLEKGLGDSWDGAHKEAWALVYGVLSTTMMEAGEKAERRQSVARASMIERSSEPRNEKETAAETFVDQ